MTEPEGTNFPLFHSISALSGFPFDDLLENLADNDEDAQTKARLCAAALSSEDIYHLHGDDLLRTTARCLGWTWNRETARSPTGERFARVRPWDFLGRITPWGIFRACYERGWSVRGPYPRLLPNPFSDPMDRIYIEFWSEGRVGSYMNTAWALLDPMDNERLTDGPDTLTAALYRAFCYACQVTARIAARRLIEADEERNAE